jgi:biotin operon repressor
MSKQLIALSPDLKRLQDEGYDIEVRERYLLVRSFPHLNSKREVLYGTLVSPLDWAGDVTTTPGTHAAFFIGETPCHADGRAMTEIITGSNRTQLEQGLTVDHSFSAKPVEGKYPNFYEKIKRHAEIICGPAKVIDPTATPEVFPVIETTEVESVFMYADTASSRAGIAAATAKLELAKVGIIGVGGSGSYILDLVAKTPVKEIHVFDGDVMLNHNAFRSPGAPSVEELRAKPFKAEYFQKLYSKMRRGVFAHTDFITEANVEELQKLDFVFLSMDGGSAKQFIIQKLQEWGVQFVDVGMGLELVKGAIGGILTVTASTKHKSDHVLGRVPVVSADKNNDYSRNIQVADLNALNAAMAVIKWKKLLGFYHDFEHEHFSAYTLDGNRLSNEDRS